MYCSVPYRSIQLHTDCRPATLHLQQESKLGVAGGAQQGAGWVRAFSSLFIQSGRRRVQRATTTKRANRAKARRKAFHSIKGFAAPCLLLDPPSWHLPSKGAGSCSFLSLPILLVLHFLFRCCITSPASEDRQGGWPAGVGAREERRVGMLGAAS